MKIKDNKGYLDFDTIIGMVTILVFVGLFGFGIFKYIYSTTVGNKQAIDMKYSFKKAIVCLGNEEIELNVKKWNDYDGEQLQIETEEGKVYLVSSFNTILISE